MVSFDLLLFIRQERGGRVKSERRERERERERAGKDAERDGQLWDHETMESNVCPPLVIPTVSERVSC